MKKYAGESIMRITTILHFTTAALLVGKWCLARKAASGAYMISGNCLRAASMGKKRSLTSV